MIIQSHSIFKDISTIVGLDRYPITDTDTDNQNIKPIPDYFLQLDIKPIPIMICRNTDISAKYQ